jgi:hypothetical protein
MCVLFFGTIIHPIQKNGQKRDCECASPAIYTLTKKKKKLFIDALHDVVADFYIIITNYIDGIATPKRSIRNQ